MLLVRVALSVGLLGGLLFVSAGRWDLPFVWAVLVLFGAYVLAASLLVDPEVAKERGRPAAAGPDRTLRLLLMASVVAHLVVAGLDVGRFHWSDTVPPALRLVGLAGYAASLAFVLWAMRVNRFFVPAVRIQEEKDHQVVRSGPYRLVRHPGYLGSAAGSLFGALALGSWAAFLPLLGALAVLATRTGFEDRFLRSELKGYADYAQEVPYRLLPGVW